MGAYYPVALWCDKSTFIHGGWSACIQKDHSRNELKSNESSRKQSAPLRKVIESGESKERP
jgi:hypothetical protein